VVLASGLPGLLLGAAGALAGLRAWYRSSIRSADSELQAMLGALDAHIRTGGAFELPASPSAAGGAPPAIVVTRIADR
jgi:hypothetical protein